MCCQDMTIARKSRSQETVVNVPSGNSVRLCERNPRRIALLISNTSTGTMGVSTLSTVTAATGFTLTATGQWIQLNFRDHGDLVHEDFYARGSAALTCSVIEVFDDGACGDE